MDGAERQQRAESFLKDFLPGAIVNTDTGTFECDLVTVERLEEAGLGLAEVVDSDGASYATYLIDETRFTQALDKIYDHEMCGLLPHGSHDNAIDSIIDGTWGETWAVYMPEHQD